MKESVISAVERLLDNYLEMNNHRKTPERYSILRAVYSIHGHFTIDELKARLDKEMDFPVSRATLYNTLSGIVSKALQNTRHVTTIRATVIRYALSAERLPR